MWSELTRGEGGEAGWLGICMGWSELEWADEWVKDGEEAGTCARAHTHPHLPQVAESHAVAHGIGAALR